MLNGASSGSQLYPPSRERYIPVMETKHVSATPSTQASQSARTGLSDVSCGPSSCATVDGTTSAMTESAATQKLGNQMRLSISSSKFLLGRLAVQVQTIHALTIGR